MHYATCLRTQRSLGFAEVIEQAHRSGEGPQRQTVVPITREAHRVKLSDLMRQAETIQIEDRI
jgi:hypothetical protein